MKLTRKQLEVLLDIITVNDPWCGVKRGDGRRLRVLSPLMERGLIEVSYNGSRAWGTSSGYKLVKSMLGMPS